MKLREIKNILINEVDIHHSSQTLDFVNPDYNDLSKLIDILSDSGNTIEGYKLYSKWFGSDVIFALVDKEILSVMVATLIPNFPSKDKKTIQTKRTWTPEQYRGKGYSSALYSGLPKMGIRVVSDAQLSPASLGVWKNLKKVWRLKAFDWDTNQFTDEDPLKKSTVSFVLETGAPVFNENGLLKESKWMTNENGVMFRYDPELFEV